jgi:hypothetical protein
MKHLLPFNANGHLFNGPDGELVTVSPSVPGDPPYVSELLSASCYVCDEYPELDITGTAVTVRAPCLYRAGTVIFAHVRLLKDYPFTSPRLAAVVTS